MDRLGDAPEIPAKVEYLEDTRKIDKQVAWTSFAAAQKNPCNSVYQVCQIGRSSILLPSLACAYLRDNGKSRSENKQ
jgi:hypothetical protein